MERWRAYSRTRAFEYLKPEDRFLSRREAPRHRLAIIGCGMMGQEHIRNALLEGRGEIAGLYDPEPRSLEHALAVTARSGQDAVPRTYSSLEEVAEDPSVDGLMVATPNYTHVDVMRALAGCDKPVFLEKPIATSLADAFEIERLIGGWNAFVHIGLQYRFKAIYVEAREEVFSRADIGAVQSVHLTEHRFPFLDKVGQWNKFDRYTGGTLVEKCCHYFDLMNLFAGSVPERVYAVGRQAVNYREFERDGQRADGLDMANVTVSYQNGVTGTFSLNMFTPGSVEELVICGSSGRLKAVEEARFGEPVDNTVEVWPGDHAPARVIKPAYPSYIESAGHHGSTFFEHVNFMDALDGREVATPSVREAIAAVVVAEAAQRSVTSDAPVEVADGLPQGALERLFAQTNGESLG